MARRWLAVAMAAGLLRLIETVVAGLFEAT
jgi:hypothetical protein